MAENNTSYSPLDQPPEHKENISNQEPIRPTAGQIEHLIATPYQGKIQHERGPTRQADRP